MKKLIIVILLALFVLGCNRASIKNENYFKIDSLKIEQVKKKTIGTPDPWWALFFTSTGMVLATFIYMRR